MINGPTADAPIPLAFPQTIRQGGIRVGAIDEFYANPSAVAFNSHDPDQAADLAWLNAHAPGWRPCVTPGAVVTRDLPVGRDLVGQFLDYEVAVLFAAAAHRDAWRARDATLRAEYAARRHHVAAQRAAAPEGVEVCSECGGHMVASSGDETYRIAQFAFTYPREAATCPQCGCQRVRLGAGAVVSDALDEIVARVGLPQRESPRWTEAVGAEWLRRKRAPAEITLAVAGLSVPALTAALDAALAATGRPVRGTPLRLTASSPDVP